MEINIVEIIKEWCRTWRDQKIISNELGSGETLSGPLLDEFVGGLQEIILQNINDFAKNEKGVNSELVLYSGVPYQSVGAYCRASGGKYYYISDTPANVLWDLPVKEENVHF